MSNEENKEVEKLPDATDTTSGDNIEIDSEEVVNEPTEQPQETQSTPVKVVKRRINYKKLGIEVAVALGVLCVVSGGAYFVESKMLDKKIEAQKQQMDKDTESFLKEQEGTITPVKIPEEALANAVNIEAKLDDLPQELVDPKPDRAFKNDKGWMLVDTNGDGVGDSYWNVTVDDVKSGKCGRMYLYTPVNRRYKQVKVQDANPAKGIKEKWISVLDMEQVMHPQFLLPIQFYEQGKGTILDWSQVNKVASDDN